MSKTMLIDFPESTIRDRSQKVTIPNLKSVVQATVTSSGSVTYVISGNDVTVSVNNVTPSRSYTDSTTRSKSVSSLSNSFSEQIYYNEGGFSGWISKYGYPSSETIQTGGSYIPSDSKTQTGKIGPQDSTSFPLTKYYNDGSYKGDLSKDGNYYQDGYRDDTQSVSDYLTSSINSFPSTKSYDQNGYTGTLSKNGTSYVISGSYTPKDTKTATDTRTNVGTAYSDWGDCSNAQQLAIDGLPQTITYNVNGYTGTLSLISSSVSSCTVTGGVDNSTFKATATGNYSGSVTRPESDTRVWRQDYSGNATKRITQYSQNYSGTVTRPEQDTRTWGTQYTQVYSGTVYGVTTNYYAYTVTLEYIDNTAPSITVKKGTSTLTNSQSILITDKNDNIFSITPSDIDTGDTLQYSIDLRGISEVPYTNIGNNATVNYTIPYSKLVLGNNVAIIRVKDSAGDITTFTVTLRNKTPSTLSNRTLLNTLTALGYANSSHASLNVLKPSGYTGKLSISDIINYLT